MNDRRASRIHHTRVYRGREFLRRLGEKCDDDEVFFMAGAIAFNLVMALFPLLVLGVGVVGYVLARFGDPTQAVLDLAGTVLPEAAGADLNALIGDMTAALVDGRTGYTIAGAVFLLWIATRLSGSMRVALREIFDIGAKRHPLHGKLFDIGAVLIGFVLLTLNMGVTIVATAAVDFGVSWFGLPGVATSWAQRGLGLIIAFGSIWALLVLAYRYVPSRTIPWRTAIIAATFTAVAHEALKLSFSWYATEVANYGSALGNLTSVAVLFFWIYYESVVFILGGEVAQVYTMRKASRVGVVSFDS